MSKELQKTNQSEISAIYDDFSGAGFENVTKDDVTVPFVKILQSGSPEVKKGSAKVEGAEEGMFYNIATGELYGEEITVIPLVFEKDFVEWAPRETGKGIQAIYKNDEILDKCEKNEKNKYVLPNGNIIEPTIKFLCLLVKDNMISPIILPFKSTQMKKAKKWVTAMKDLRHYDAKTKEYKVLPMFANQYTFTTETETKDDNSWSGYKRISSQPVEKMEFIKIAIDVYKQYKAGEIKAATEAEDTTEDDLAF